MSSVVPFPAPTCVQKRDGRLVGFDEARIARAIGLCFKDVERERDGEAPVAELTRLAANVVRVRHREVASVEAIQDVVEHVLLADGEYEAARHYIRYRDEKARLRQESPIPEEVRAAFAAAKPYFGGSLLREVQFYDKYSRWDEARARRETWAECAGRSVSFFREIAQGRGAILPATLFEEIEAGILDTRVLPSMRLLAMAGPAARRSNITTYNCSFCTISDMTAFVEVLIISMSGCGAGYSVEAQHVEQLPKVKRQRGVLASQHVVGDSVEGWAEALRVGLEAWFGGYDVRFDYSQVRPAGSILRTKGGRASGPGPLRAMLDFVRARILARAGSCLRPIDAHHIVCKIGDAAVSGGCRRTAMIALYSRGDLEMRHCKDGDLVALGHTHLWNANNSEVWEHPLTTLEIADQMLAMFKSQRGEPGIFSRYAALATRPVRRGAAEFGCNPCSEVILRTYQFCNLSAAVARAHETEDTLRGKVRLATIIGTLQATLTHFPGLRDDWRRNCEDERLLGVDITGQMDSPISRDPQVKARLKEYALGVHREYARLLGINESAAITVVKPSGNTSVLVDCASGLHARYAKYYIRNFRIDAHSALFRVLRDAGVPMDPENGKTAETAVAWVVHFPVASPEGAITRHDLTAIDQLNYWLSNKQSWTEHQPSVSIYVKPGEELAVMQWVADHQEWIGGLTFYPSDDARYDQAPYVEISREEYERLAAAFPADVDLAKIVRYEAADYTAASTTGACEGDRCLFNPSATDGGKS